MSFTGITDARASFTEYDVSVVDSSLESEQQSLSSGGRFQGLISNLLRSRGAGGGAKDDLGTLEEGHNEGANDDSDNATGLNVEELGVASQYSVSRFFSERFPWMSMSQRPDESGNASRRDNQEAQDKLDAAPDTAAVNFTGYDPYQFYRIRKASGVSEREFMEAFSETVKERLQDGGASGAFFFFSKGERFMAKSCSEDELMNIRVNINTYADYFEKNPMSCIARIYGAFQLRIYSTSFYFYVMHNIFLSLDNEIVNEKYDIKGSWVNRNAAVPREGQVVTCSNCNQKFKFDPSQKAIKKANRAAMKQGKIGNTTPSPVVSLDDFTRSTMYSLNVMNWFRSTSVATDAEEDTRSKRCLLTVTGKHEPNVVLKDNDLKHKLKIAPEAAKQLLHQLKKDAELLCDQIAVMDYSLLVGVHNTVYEVEEQPPLHAHAASVAEEKKEGLESSSLIDSGGRTTLSARPSNQHPASRFPVCIIYYILSMHCIIFGIMSQFSSR